MELIRDFYGCINRNEIIQRGNMLERKVKQEYFMENNKSSNFLPVKMTSDKGHTYDNTEVKYPQTSAPD
jgi:hypothetical protein